MPDNINYIDLLLILPLAWAAYKGFRRGLVLEIASIVGLIAGVYAAIKFSGFIASKLDPHLDISESWLGIISFVITFIGVVFLVNILGKVLEKTIKMVALGMLNRIAGSLFSLLKTVLILSFLIFFINQFDSVFRIIPIETKSGSMLYGPIQKVAPNIMPVIQELEINKYLGQQEADSE